ncbi:uncharacterized protein N7482_007106 [Penicillium canariense]|uniref:GATA-type domain-containing protein n=1 Tax=Penicillium canariense TaxID=189055 RepID=A0A9W9HW57_9EURO|nr:uncharacterized protein N7482_007106 [Penicillium canariense]KAJ5160102.1 hypothetical protein N7482_007106 [Penicillium canariense]
MESQDGITVRPMRLKVLYTFDNENKTNCLARWPHVLELQTAFLDEQTQIGVIELKTCIQAIVSASPELVAQLGKDYTVYAYDYSEYETPLVGQGMLSWVLASASPTPDAPAHQSKTMVTGRVCKNPLGLFSKGAQETLEVKLRLVPVPTVMQSEYLESMQKYRELSNVIPHDFDAQTWTNFVRQNPALLEASRIQQQCRVSSPMDQSGIERVHQLLSESTTPREYPSYPTNESVRSSSPTHSFGPPSRMSTPGGTRTPTQHHQQSQPKQSFAHSDNIRPSSSASMHDSDFQLQHFNALHRRGSMNSGYGSGGEDSAEPQPRKRAKLYQAGWPGKSDMNIERQPSSLRVAASTAASVRIHRPTPVNPAIAAEQSQEEPVRPPTPISLPGNLQRRGRPPSSMLRESSTHSLATYTSPYHLSDDVGTDQTAHSPEERYQGLFEPPFSMPSSPPVLESRFPARSSPNLPPISLDTDSGFMSGSLEDLMDDGAGTPVEDARTTDSRAVTGEKRSRSVRSAVHATSPASAMGLMSEGLNDSMLVSDGPTEQQSNQAPPIPRPNTSAGSRPSSRTSCRPTPKPLAPAPMSQSELEQLMRAVPLSDPVGPAPASLQYSQTWAGPMSDFSIIDTPAPQPEFTRRAPRSGGAAKRSMQVQARLDSAIANGMVPPYCENCGTIDTPTWRRAWSKEVAGSEEGAKEMMKPHSMLFWEALERDDKDEVVKFKIYKKGLGTTAEDQGWTQVLLCNPCGLWLHKCKSMRPENRWNKQPPAYRTDSKQKRSSRNRKQSGGPLSKPSTRTRSKAVSSRTAVSSPAPTEASSVQNEEGTTPNPEGDRHGQVQDPDDEVEEYPNKRRRANSAEPPRSSEKPCWEQQDAIEALRLAIQSSPARNIGNRNLSGQDATKLTPKPVRRALFPSNQKESPLKELCPSFVNSCSPRRSPRLTKGERPAQEKENNAPTPQDDLDGLFEGSSMDFDLPVSPTPRRRHTRPNAVHERRRSLPCNSPTANKRKDVGLAATAARLTAERLQRIQDGPEHSPRPSAIQNRSPNKHFAPALSDAALHSEAFGSLDGMILDIFEEASDQASSFHLDHAKLSGNNWADWLPSDYVSPSASDEDNNPSDDLINAILSDPAILKENLLDSKFNPFTFGDNDVPDSGFFSSDALQTDPAVASTQAAKPPKERGQAPSPTA